LREDAAERLREEWRALGEAVTAVVEAEQGELAGCLARIEESCRRLDDVLESAFRAASCACDTQTPELYSHAREGLQRMRESAAELRRRCEADAEADSSLKELEAELKRCEEELERARQQAELARQRYRERMDEYARVRNSLDDELSAQLALLKHEFVREVAEFSEELEFRARGMKVSAERLLEEFCRGERTEVAPRAGLVGKLMPGTQEVRASINLVEMKLREYRNEIDSLKRRRMEREVAVLQEFSDLPALRSEMVAAERRCSELEERIASLKDRMRELKRAKLSPEHVLEALGRLAEGWRAAEGAVVQVFEVLDGERDSDPERRALRRRVRELREALSRSEAEVAELRRRIEELGKRVAELEGKLEAEAEMRKGAEAELKRLRRVNAELSAMLASGQSSSEKLMESARREVERVAELCMSGEEGVGEALKRCSAAAEMLAGLGREAEDVLAGLRVCSRLLREAAAEAEARGRAEALRDAARVAQHTLDELAELAGRLRAEVEQAKRDEQTLKALREENRKLKSEVRMLRASLKRKNELLERYVEEKTSALRRF